MSGDLVAAALEALDLPYERGDHAIRGFMGQRTPAEFKIRTNAHDYDIGLRRHENEYEIVADWWGVRGFDERSFSESLTRAYSVAATKDTLAAQGYTLISEQQEANGELRLVLRRHT